jgi:hypothetical protein
MPTSSFALIKRQASVSFKAHGLGARAGSSTAVQVKGNPTFQPCQQNINPGKTLFLFEWHAKLLPDGLEGAELSSAACPSFETAATFTSTGPYCGRCILELFFPWWTSTRSALNAFVTGRDLTEVQQPRFPNINAGRACMLPLQLRGLCQKLPKAVPFEPLVLGWDGCR